MRKKILFLLGLVIITGSITVLSLRHEFLLTQQQIHSSLDAIEPAPVALVFGAGIRADGTVSDVLRDRLIAAAELYHANKVKKLLFSGDNGRVAYDEVSAMKLYSKEMLSIPEEDIVLDYAGFDTYDSCYRAQEIFGVTNTIAVSQAFHLPRIVFTCQGLGIHTQGYVADKQAYVYARMYLWRERLAQGKAWIELRILHSKPTFLGKKEPIFE